MDVRKSSLNENHREESIQPRRKECVQFMRINKAIAELGICSRRKADELILQGKVKLNGEKVLSLGIQVDLERDFLEVDGQRKEKPENKVVLMLHKPEGVLTSVGDPSGRKTVMHFMDGVKERLFHVGRLDFDTSGLLLMTNDGDLAQKLMHPAKQVEKCYIATLMGIPSEKAMEVFEKGLDIEGKKTAPAKIKILRRMSKQCEVEIKIHEGRNRQIRKMCQKLGYKVLFLTRISIGEIQLGDLKVGQYRFLNEQEKAYLNRLPAGNLNEQNKVTKTK